MLQDFWNNIGSIAYIVGMAVLFLALILVVIFSIKYGALWFQAYMSSASVSPISLIGMSLRNVRPSLIVNEKIVLSQSGLSESQRDSLSCAVLEAHVLAGGDITRVIRAMVIADRAGLTLDFDLAASIDLAGRDVLDAVRTSVFPKIIDCPESEGGRKMTLSAVAKDGVEVRIHATVTVRTNLARLIGGATEQTIIARVGQGIVSVVGNADSYAKVLEAPDLVSKGVLERGLDDNTSFDIVSIDIAEIEIGKNIGARLQAEQASADTRMAQAAAEARRAMALALKQEMKAMRIESLAQLGLAEAEIPLALAEAVRGGRIHIARRNVTAGMRATRPIRLPESASNRTNPRGPPRQSSSSPSLPRTPQQDAT
jgi:uncharacterized protein YqfA (UPF0365 family)